MEIKEFESLKKKHDELQLLKAREEAKLESLERDLETYRVQLRELGITDLGDNVETILSEKEKELTSQYSEISSLLSQLES